MKLCVCCQWPKRFYTAGELKSHLLVHSDYKQFCCFWCGKCFKRKTCVKQHFSRCAHSMMHNDDWSAFVCLCVCLLSVTKAYTQIRNSFAVFSVVNVSNVKLVLNSTSTWRIVMCDQHLCVCTCTNFEDLRTLRSSVSFFSFFLFFCSLLLLWCRAVSCLSCWSCSLFCTVADTSSLLCVSVSYTHLTLPTKRIV